MENAADRSGYKMNKRIYKHNARFNLRFHPYRIYNTLNVLFSRLA